MVIVSLKGGLGNQMFQYATARGISKGKKIVLNQNFFTSHSITSETFTARRFELNIFKNLKARNLSRIERAILFNNRLSRVRDIVFPSFQNVSQKENEYVNIDSSLTPISLDGYFQSEKYFLSIRSELLKEFEFPRVDRRCSEMYNEISNTRNSVSLHVRRGDYLKPEISLYHGILPTKYYQDASELIESQISDPHYFIFSDDIEWCKENLTFLNKRSLVYTTKEVEPWNDMMLMSKCQHHIIANSSFSWWGAWLSENKGITTAPANWFNPQKAIFQIQDFVPESWMIIDYD